MKKVLLISVAIAATLFASSCNKEEDVRTLDGANKEISIMAMASTKSAVNSNSFPAGYDMLISAYRNIGSHAGNDGSANYFEGIPFTKTGDSWKSTRGAKYYPLDGTLDFLAVASAGYKTAANGIAPTAVWGANSNVAKQVVLTVPDNSTKFDDLLYGASNDQGLSENGTTMVFKHAMASVVFIAKSNVAYDAVTNAGITIDGITIDGAKYSGTLTVSNPSAGKGSGDLSAAWTNLGDAKTHIAARSWNAANLGTNASETALSGLNLTTTAKSIANYPFGEGYVILPPQAAVPFTVTYTIHNGFAANGSTPLDSQVEYQFTPSGNWDIGKKYVYNLDFSLTEVIISPTVEDWDSQDTIVVPITGEEEPDFSGLTGTVAGHDWVDLGIVVNGNRVLFATTNVGAENPEDFGDYFAWGETTKRYTSINGNTIVGGTFTQANAPFYSNGDYTKYNFYDRLSELTASDDVASIQWGSGWRMPDIYELHAIFGDIRTTRQWTNNYNSTGVAGFIITGKGTYSGNSIFLPAAGCCSGSSRVNAGNEHSYWSSTFIDEEITEEQFGEYINFAWGRFWIHDEGEEYNGYRNTGCTVRPVLVIENAEDPYVEEELPQCPHCGEYYNIDELEDDVYCPNCGENVYEEVEEEEQDAVILCPYCEEEFFGYQIINTSGILETCPNCHKSNIFMEELPEIYETEMGTLFTTEISGTENGHDWVDLGIVVNGHQILFATCNVGAENPWNYGDYFAWGETTKHYTSINGNTIVGGTFTEANAPYSIAMQEQPGYNFRIYNKWHINHGIFQLTSGDDPAFANWNNLSNDVGYWRTPTLQELEALYSNQVTREWTNNYNSTGIAGVVITGKGDYSGNSIFIPAGGTAYNSRFYDKGTISTLWSKDLDREYEEELLEGTIDYYRFYQASYSFANCIQLYDPEEEPEVTTSLHRCTGANVRPIIYKAEIAEEEEEIVEEEEE